MIQHCIDVHVVEHQHRRMAAQFHRRALHAGAASAASCLPTGIDPVKCTARITGEAIRCCDTSAGTPNTTAITPSGTPASTSACAMASAQAGVSSAGLTMTLQPAPSAAPSLRAGLPSGKFHGANAGHRTHRFLDHRHAHAGNALRQHAAVGAASLFRIPVEDLGGDRSVRHAPRPAPCLPPAWPGARWHRHAPASGRPPCAGSGRAAAAPGHATPARRAARLPVPGPGPRPWQAADRPAPLRLRD